MSPTAGANRLSDRAKPSWDILCVLALVQPRPREIKHGTEEGGCGPDGRDCAHQPPTPNPRMKTHSLGMGWGGSPPSSLDSFSICGKRSFELLMRDEN